MKPTFNQDDHPTNVPDPPLVSFDMGAESVHMAGSLAWVLSPTRQYILMQQ